MTELTQILDRTVSPKAGLITSLFEAPYEVNKAPLHIYRAKFQDPTVLYKGTAEKRVRSTLSSTGADLDREKAIWSTIGEAIERYAASNWMHLSQIKGTADELPGAEHFLRKVIYYREEDYADPDFEFAPPDPSKPRHWLKGVSLKSGEPYHVPAASVCMSVEALHRGEILDRCYSTGLASHTSYDAAIHSGLCEVIERDGYTSYWFSKAVPDMLSPDLVKSLIPTRLSEWIEKLGLNIRVFAMRTDIEVPIIVSCVKIDDGGIATGASCNLDITDAVTKAVVESLHTYSWCLDMKRHDIIVENKSDINDFSEHVAYYLTHERSESYQWWVDDPVILTEIPSEWVTSTGSPKEKMDILVERLAKAEFEPAWLDITSLDIAELGFVAVKTFVAGLHPLSSGYSYTQNDPRRIAQFARYRGIEWSGHVELDPPHAFP